MKQLLFTFITLMMLIALSSVANASSNKNKIHSIQSKISQDENQLEKLQRELKSSETKIGQLSKNIHHTAGSISSGQNHLQQSKEKLALYQQQLNQQRDFFRQQLAANYVLERQGQWNIYFSGDSAGDVSRYLAYYHAVNKAQLAMIQTMQSTIKQLKSTSKDIQINTQHLKSLYKQLKEEQQQTNAQQTERQHVVTQINKSIQGNQKELQSLQRNQTSLSHLVQHLDISHVTRKFTGMRKKLPWPVKGKVIHYFNAPVTNSNLSWKGDLIAAVQGTPVQASFGGKVIYADWLRGYGLLLIIDHGDGFMSLYGRNHSLYKAVGDNVAIGETIATVGRSGGFQTSALYFELRHKGVPLNPRNWMGKM
jgi:septal ring factor EnvC (AmiA/AmiB activator)